MESRTGRIAQQLTQWIGGTIVLLMLGFVIFDLVTQSVQYRRYYTSMAEQGVEGLRQFLAGRRLSDEPLQLAAASEYLGYVTGRRNGFMVFDATGQGIYATPLALSVEPAETESLFVVPPEDSIVTFRRTISGTSVIAAAAHFQTRDADPLQGVAVYLVNVSDFRQAALFLWGWRSAIILVIIIGVMLAVRVPVRKFVLRPMDGLFVAAYAASKDDYEGLPECPVDNEFKDLYDMFGRLMGHLSDTRVYEATLLNNESTEPGAEEKSDG